MAFQREIDIRINTRTAEQKLNSLGTAFSQADVKSSKFSNTLTGLSIGFGKVDKSADGAANSIDKTNKELRETTATASRASAAIDKSSRSLGQVRNIAQQAGFQLQDVAVQLQAGTNAFTVLGQQGSQFAGAFGPTGAVVGAVIAVGSAIAGALIPSLADAGDEAEALEEKFSQLVDQYDNLTSAQQRFISSTANVKIRELEQQINALSNEAESLQNTLASPIQLSDDQLKTFSDRLIQITSDIDTFQSEIDTLRGTTDGVSDSAEDYIESLNKQALSLTANNVQLAVYNARLEGANEEQLERVVRLVNTIDAIKKEREEERKLIVTRRIKERQQQREAAAVEKANKAAEDAVDLLSRERIAVELGEKELFIYRQTKSTIAKIEESSLPNKEALVQAARDEAAAIFDLNEEQKKIEQQEKENQRAAEESERQYKKTYETLSDGITDAIVEFKSLEDIATSVAKNIARAFVQQQITAPILSSFGFAAPGSGGGAGLAGSASSISNLFGGGTTSSLFNTFATSGIGQSLGLSTGIAGSQLASQFGLTTGVAGSGGLTAAGSALSGVASAAPVIGALVGGFNLLKGFRGDPEQRFGQEILFSQGQGVSTGRTSVGGSLAQQELEQLTGTLISNINRALSVAGSDALVESFAARLQSSTKGVGGVAAGGTLSTGAAFGEGLGSQFFVERVFSEGGIRDRELLDILFPTFEGGRGDLTPEQAVEAFQLDLQQSYIQALQAANLGGALSEFISRVIDAEALDPERAAATVAGIETITAYTAGIKSLNTALGDFAAGDLGGLSADSILRLSEASGGVNNLLGTISGYYDLVLTEEQKRELQTNRLTSAFDAINLTLPSSIEGFRELAQSIDTSTNAGADQLFQLLQLTPAFREYIETLDVATDTVVAATENLRDVVLNDINQSFSGLSSLISNQRDLINERYDSEISGIQEVADRESELNRARLSDINDQQQALRATRSIVQSLVSFVDRSRTGRAVDDLASRGSARSVIQSALTSGVLPDSRTIERAISALSVDSQRLFGTQTDFLRDFFTTANEVEQLADRTDKQLTVEEESLAAQEASLSRNTEFYSDMIRLANEQRRIELKQLDDQLDQHREIVDIINGVPTTLEDGFVSIAAAIASLQGAISGLSGVADEFSNDQIYDAVIEIQERFRRDDGTLDLDAANRQVGLTAIQFGVSSARLAESTGVSQEAILAEASRLGIPAFQNGGFHSGGFRIVGEREPELEFTPPSRIFNQSQMDDLFDMSELVIEVRALRDDMNAANRVIATNTLRTSKTLNRWEGDGLPPERSNT